jgi:co-chaperonin GroES (HSP10)
MKETIRLFRDLILVKKVDAPPRTPAGLFIPATVDEDHAAYYEVLSVGSKVDEIKPGDKIVTNSKTGGQEFSFNGVDLLVMRARNVMGVME